jgi:transposase
MKEKSVIIKAVMKFLEIFMCKTLAQRITSMILLAVGMPNKQIAEITGFCERSVRELKKRIETEEIGKLFVVGGGGRKRKLKDVESGISEEIGQNNYHSRQQVADMILEKYGIKVSLPCVGRLLKKTGLND